MNGRVTIIQQRSDNSLGLGHLVAAKLTPDQIPSTAIDAAIEEYEAASLSGLGERESFAALIAAAINLWPSGKSESVRLTEIVLHIPFPERALAISDDIDSSRTRCANQRLRFRPVI